MSTGSASWEAARVEKSMPPLMAEMAAWKIASATMLSLPATCLMSMMYSEISESWHCCHTDQVSDILLRANVSGLWLVKSEN